MTSFPFLNLPREIRDQIYEWVFPFKSSFIVPVCQGLSMTVNLEDDDETPTPFHLDRRFYVCSQGAVSSLKCKHRFKIQAQQVLKLMLVNRQISSEFAAYFYASLTFSGRPSALSDLSSFIKGIGPFRRDLIKTLDLDARISSHPPLDFGDFDLFCTLGNLQKVTIETSQPDTAIVQKALIRGGIHKLKGLVDLAVRNTTKRVVIHRLEEILKFEEWKTTTWTCAKGQTKWTGVTRLEILFKGWPGTEL